MICTGLRLRTPITPGGTDVLPEWLRHGRVAPTASLEPVGVAMAAPKAKPRLAFCRRLAASPHGGRLTNAAAGFPAPATPARARQKMHSTGYLRLGPGPRSRRRPGSHWRWRSILEHAPCRVASATFPDLDDIEGLPGGSTSLRRALAVAFRKLTLGTLLHPADGDDDDPHAGRSERTLVPAAGRFQLARRPCGRVVTHIFSRL